MCVILGGMTTKRGPAVAPDPFVFVVEERPVRYFPKSQSRRRECFYCHHSQTVRYGLSMPRDYHWCQREIQRYFVVWDVQ